MSRRADLATRRRQQRAANRNTAAQQRMSAAVQARNETGTLLFSADAVTDRMPASSTEAERLAKQHANNLDANLARDGYEYSPDKHMPMHRTQVNQQLVAIVKEKMQTNQYESWPTWMRNTFKGDLFIALCSEGFFAAFVFNVLNTFSHSEIESLGWSEGATDTAKIVATIAAISLTAGDLVSNLLTTAPQDAYSVLSSSHDRTARMITAVLGEATFEFLKNSKVANPSEAAQQNKQDRILENLKAYIGKTRYNEIFLDHSNTISPDFITALFDEVKPGSKKQGAAQIMYWIVTLMAVFTSYDILILAEIIPFMSLKETNPVAFWMLSTVIMAAGVGFYAAFTDKKLKSGCDAVVAKLTAGRHGSFTKSFFMYNVEPTDSWGTSFAKIPRSLSLRFNGMLDAGFNIGFRSVATLYIFLSALEPNAAGRVNLSSTEVRLLITAAATTAVVTALSRAEGSLKAHTPDALGVATDKLAWRNISKSDWMTNLVHSAIRGGTTYGIISRADQTWGIVVGAAIGLNCLYASSDISRNQAATALANAEKPAEVKKPFRQMTKVELIGQIGSSDSKRRWLTVVNVLSRTSRFATFYGFSEDIIRNFFNTTLDMDLPDDSRFITYIWALLGLGIFINDFKFMSPVYQEVVDNNAARLAIAKFRSQTNDGRCATLLEFVKLYFTEAERLSHQELVDVALGNPGRAEVTPLLGAGDRRVTATGLARAAANALSINSLGTTRRVGDYGTGRGGASASDGGMFSQQLHNTRRPAAERRAADVDSDSASYSATGSSSLA